MLGANARLSTSHGQCHDFKFIEYRFPNNLVIPKDNDDIHSPESVPKVIRSADHMHFSPQSSRPQIENTWFPQQNEGPFETGGDTAVHLKDLNADACEDSSAVHPVRAARLQQPFCTPQHASGRSPTAPIVGASITLCGRAAKVLQELELL